MGVDISPLKEDEISDAVHIELEAFRSHPRIPMLWRRGYTDDVYAWYEYNKKESFADPECRFMKAVDADSGRMVAVSEWTFALDPAKHEDKPVDPNGTPPANWPIDGNWELRKFFNLNLEKWVQTYLAGKPYISTYRPVALGRRTDTVIELEILVTNPQSHGQGAGSKLLAWGAEQADKHSVRMALEATPAGLKLYRRFGFREMEVIKADMKQFGWDKPYDPEAAKRVWMIREPQKTDSTG